MGLITVELAGQLIDEVTAIAMRYRGVTGQTYGIGVPGGTFGAAARANTLNRKILESADEHVTASLSSIARNLKNNTVDALEQAARDLEGFIDAFGRHARDQQPAASVIDLNSFLSYYNTGAGGTGLCLVPPYFYDLYLEAKGEAPSRGNVYFECKQGESYLGTTFTNALLKFVISGAGTGTPTDGVDIGTDYAYTCGGIPVLNFASGWAGASDSITLTGDFYDPATQAVETNKTCVFTGVAANGRYYRGAGGTAAANALLVDGVSVVAGNNITAGTFYIETERPVLSTGAAQAGGASTITLASTASDSESYYSDPALEVAHSRDLYTVRTASAYNNETKVLTISSTWATNPQAADTYKIYRLKLP